MPTPAPFPSFSSTLSANSNPTTIDAGPLGKVMVNGVLSGIGFAQSSAGYDFYGVRNKSSYGDLSNATVMINKADGPIQFFVMAGAYSLPALGTPYLKADKTDDALFGFIQQGFVKFVPNGNFNIEVGLLPTMIGAEYTATFQNINIERGLLWNQENLATRGFQINYTNGPWAVSGSLNDGFYSNNYSSVSGLVTYTFKNMDTLSVVGMGPLSKIKQNTFVTPGTLANSSVFNLIYSHSMGPWTINPYVQYTSVSSVAAYTPSGSTTGVALLAKYTATPEINFSGRVEYISTSGKANLLYGPKSDAWSLTGTITWQKGIFFARGEGSYVSTSGTAGAMFGPNGADTSQSRIIAESGVIF